MTQSQSIAFVITELARFGYNPDFFDADGTPGIYCRVDGVDHEVLIRYHDDAYHYDIHDRIDNEVLRCECDNMKKLIGCLLDDGGQILNVPVKGAINDANDD